MTAASQVGEPIGRWDREHGTKRATDTVPSTTHNKRALAIQKRGKNKNEEQRPSGTKQGTYATGGRKRGTDVRGRGERLHIVTLCCTPIDRASLVFPTSKPTSRGGYLMYSLISLAALFCVLCVSHEVHESSVIDLPYKAILVFFWSGGRSLALAPEVEEHCLASTAVQRSVFGKRHAGPCRTPTWRYYVLAIDCRYHWLVSIPQSCMSSR